MITLITFVRKQFPFPVQSLKKLTGDFADVAIRPVRDAYKMSNSIDFRFMFQCSPLHLDRNFFMLDSETSTNYGKLMAYCQILLSYNNVVIVSNRICNNRYYTQFTRNSQLEIEKQIKPIFPNFSESFFFFRIW